MLGIRKNKNPKERKNVWVHITLTRDVSGVKVTHKGDRPLIPLTRPMVLRSKESAMVVPPF